MIKKISSRHNVAPIFILFSHKKNSNSNTIIHDAIYWENKSRKINKNLKTLIIFYMVFSFLLLLSSEFINGNINDLIFSIFTISINFTFLLSIYIYHRSFKIPKIIDIKPILLVISILCILTILN